MEDIRNEKAKLRKEILALRRKLTPDEVRERSRKICDNVKASGSYSLARDICLYMPIRNEVDVTLLIEDAEADGKRIWLPRVEEHVMDFFLYRGRDDLVSGSFGIMEPAADIVLEPGRDTLVVLPGAVFSVSCQRIGYGGGFYDRYLAAHPLCMTAGVCYDFQLLPQIPAEDHDIRPDIIISEG